MFAGRGACQPPTESWSAGCEFDACVYGAYHHKGEPGLTCELAIKSPALLCRSESDHETHEKAEHLGSGWLFVGYTRIVIQTLEYVAMQGLRFQ